MKALGRCRRRNGKTDCGRKRRREGIVGRVKGEAVLCRVRKGQLDSSQAAVQQSYTAQAGILDPTQRHEHRLDHQQVLQVISWQPPAKIPILMPSPFCSSRKTRAERHGPIRTAPMWRITGGRGEGEQLRWKRDGRTRTHSRGRLPWQPSFSDGNTHLTVMNIHRSKGSELHTVFMQFSIKHISIRSRERKIH